MPEHLYLRGMVVIRVLSGVLELTGAFLMWRLGRLDLAVRINGVLGLFGPLVLTTTMAIGIAGLAGRIAPGKLVWIAVGVLFILFGTSR